MEEIHAAGKTRFLGVSNVALDQLESSARSRACSRCSCRTAATRRRVGMPTCARSAGAPGSSTRDSRCSPRTSAELRSARFREIVARVGRTPAQVVFRFARQVGMLPLTGTTDAAHMREDLAIDDFRCRPRTWRRSNTYSCRPRRRKSEWPVRSSDRSSSLSSSSASSSARKPRRNPHPRAAAAARRSGAGRYNQTADVRGVRAGLQGPESMRAVADHVRAGNDSRAPLHVPGRCRPQDAELRRHLLVEHLPGDELARDDRELRGRHVEVDPEREERRRHVRGLADVHAGRERVRESRLSEAGRVVQRQQSRGGRRSASSTTRRRRPAPRRSSADRS